MVANNGGPRSVCGGILAGLAGAGLLFVAGCGALAVLILIILGALGAMFGRR